ncbi:hypothetical protein, partial [Streptomyces sp. NPDC002758]
WAHACTGAIPTFPQLNPCFRLIRMPTNCGTQVVGLGRSWKQGQQIQLGASPESYLLRVEKGLKPRALLAKVRNPRRHDDRTT